MARRSTFVALAVLALAATVTFSGAGASAPSDPTHPSRQVPQPATWTTAMRRRVLRRSPIPPRSQSARSPPARSPVPSMWVQHNNFGAYFRPSFDREVDGNAGVVFNPPPASRPTTRTSATGTATPA